MSHPSLRVSIETLFVAVALNSAATAQVPGLDNPTAVGAFLNGALPATAPGAASGWTTENAFPNLTWTDPLWMLPYPATANDLIMVTKQGLIYRFDNDPAVLPGAMVEILDWSANTETSEDQGFYSLAFHPEFGQVASPNRGYVYVCYNHRYQTGVDNNDNTYWRLTRFTMPDGPGGVPDGNSIIDPGSETILISQFDPNRWHNGGPLFFGPKGYLYACSGDGGGAGDPFGYSQQMDQGFFGGVYRLDVDMNPATSHAIRRQPTDTGRPGGWPVSYSDNYFIPNDNPFNDPLPYTNPSGIMEEFFGVGLRSPHTMHYDSVSGQVWVGDVGQGTREEISVFTLDPVDPIVADEGPNLQWAYKEGIVNGPKATPGTIAGIETVPIHDYPRSEGRCIIGGFRYRGSAYAGPLGGKILFGDHVLGRIWSIEYTEGQAPVIEELIGGFHTGGKAGLGNFCQDQNGEIYMMDLNGTDNPGGIVQKLVAVGVGGAAPPLLSGTGAFTDIVNLVPSPVMVPYTVGNPLWSDNSHKARWMILPNDGTHDTAAEQITFSEKDNWVFPEGTVLVKHFELPTDEDNPSTTVRLETRFLVCTAGGGKYGLTYRWRPDQTEADLLTAGETGDYTIQESGGGSHIQTWQFPSSGDCLFCHNTAAGQALGVRTYQMNADNYYPSTGRTSNQMLTWNSIGMFDTALTPAQLEDYLEARPLDDDSAPLEHRVRSYLDSNCSHCHRPGAPGGVFDARLSTPLSGQNIVNGDLDLFVLNPSGKIVKPGDVPMSAIHFRMDHTNPDPNSMPPLAKNLLDTVAVQHMSDWINGLVDAEFQLTGGASGRYAKFIADSELNGAVWASMAELNILDAGGVVIPQNTITLDDFNLEELVGEDGAASNILDGDTGTIWHTSWQGPDANTPHPHYVTVDLGSVKSIGGFKYLPRQAGVNGRIADWRFEVSDNGTTFTQVASGTFPAGTAEQTFDSLLGTRAARPILGGPTGIVAGNFDVTLVLDYDVTDVDTSDFTVTGGSMVGIRGEGYYYVATIAPSSSSVTVNMPLDALAGPGGGGNIASNTLVIGVADFPGIYGAWAAGHGLSGVPGERATNGEGDDMTNDLEFLFNFNPNLSDGGIYDPGAVVGAGGPVGLPLITGEPQPGGALRIEVVYLRRKAAVTEGYLYDVEFSDDLTPSGWVEFAGSETVESIDADWERVTVEDTVDSSTKSERFGRVKVKFPW